MSFLDALSFGPKITFPQEKPADQPSPYASQEEWAAYRRRQAMVHNNSGMTPQAMEAAAMVDTLAKSIGAGRGMVNPESVTPMELGPEADTGNAGRGSVNPAPVNPDDTPEAGILGAAFPEVFRKNPPKDTPDTTFGVEKVNARTAEHGVTAIRKDGKIYMTNINADGTVNRGTGSANSLTGDGKGTVGREPSSLSVPNVSGAITSTLDQLRTTDDYSKARGLMGNLAATLAEQKANMETQAIGMANAKFNVPQLETMLAQAVQADQADPMWYPGIGDSPITAKLRAEIGQAYINARQFANTYLNSNASYASLGVHEKVANAEFERIKSVTTRKQNKEDDAAGKSAEWDRRILELARDEMSQYSTQEINRLVILNPELGIIPEGKSEKDPVAITKFAKANPKALEAIKATPTQLPILALEGNAAARVLIARLESGGMNEQEIDARLSAVTKLANEPDFNVKYATWKYPNNKGERDTYVQNMTQLKLSTDKTGKEEHRRQQLQNALEMVRGQQTVNAANDIRLVLPKDGIYAGAIEQALKVTGNASLKNVALALLKDAKTKEEATARKMMLSQDIQNALRSRPQSVFGSPDANKLQQELIESTRTMWDRVEGALTSRSENIQSTFDAVYK